MDNKDDLQIEGRVTRSLRKRLTSIDSDGTLSRPSTPISTKLPQISENSSPKRRTRRYSATNTSPTPSKTPSARKRMASALRLDNTTVENSPLRRCTRRLSANISIIKEEQLCAKEEEKFVIDEKFAKERVTRSTTKSPQDSNAVPDMESDTNMKSSPKKREETKKNSTKSELRKRSTTLRNDHCDIEVINLVDDSNVPDCEKKQKEISSTESTEGVSDPKSSPNSIEDVDKTVKLEKADTNSPSGGEDSQSKAYEELKSGSEENESSHSKSEKPIEVLEDIDKSICDGNDLEEKKENSAMLKENIKNNINEKSLTTPKKCGESLIIEVLELSTLSSQRLAELIESANNSPVVEGHGIQKSVSFKQSTEEIVDKSSFPKTPRISKSKRLLKEDYSNKETDKSAHEQEVIEEEENDDLADKENVLKSKNSAKEGPDNDNSKTPFKSTLNKIQSSTPISSKISVSHEPHIVSLDAEKSNREHHEQLESDLLSVAPKEISLNNDDKSIVDDKADDAFSKKDQNDVKHLESTRENSAVVKDSSTSELGEDGQEEDSSPGNNKSIISRSKQNLSFPSSWMQNVAASAEVGSKIDNISAEMEKIPIVSKTTANDEIRTEKSNLEPNDEIDQIHSDAVDKTTIEEELNTVDLESVSEDEVEMLTENENSCNDNEFAFNEAEDAGDDYKSGDSMCSDERREIIENEISVDGESIASVSTHDEEEEEMESEGDDSFIVHDSEVEHYSQDDSNGDDENYSKIQNKKNVSSSKTYKRILSCSSSEEDEKDIVNISSAKNQDTKAPTPNKHKNQSFTIAHSESSLESSPNNKDKHQSNQKSSAKKISNSESFISKNKDESLIGSIEKNEQDLIEKTYQASNINLNTSHQVENEKTEAADVDVEKTSSGITDEISNIDGNITGITKSKSENSTVHTVRNSSISDRKGKNNVDRSFNEDKIKKSNFAKKYTSNQLNQSERLNKTVPAAQISKCTKSLSANDLSGDHTTACRNNLSLGNYQTSRKSLLNFHSKELPSATRNIRRNSDSSNDSTEVDSDGNNDNFQIFENNQKSCSSSAESSVCSYKANKENEVIADEEEKMSSNKDSNESSIENCAEEILNEIKVGDNKNLPIPDEYSERRQSHPTVLTKTGIANNSHIGEVSTISIYDTEEESDSKANGITNKLNRKDRKSIIKKSASGLSVSFSKVNEMKKSNSVQTEIAHRSFTIGITVNSKAGASISQPLFPLQSSSDNEERNPTDGSSELVFNDSDGEEITNLKNSRDSGKLSTKSQSRRQSRETNIEATLKEIQTNETEESVVDEPEEPKLVSETFEDHTENELVERQTTKRKRPSDSYCSGDVLDTTASEMNLCKKSRRISSYGALEKCLVSESPIAKPSKNSDENNKDHIQKILSRCDEILEAANQAKLQAKLNYQKSKVRIPKQKKRKEIVKETNECTTEEVLADEEKTRREKAKKEIEGALKASKDIILKNPVNKLNPARKSKEDDDQLISRATLTQKRKEMEKELSTLTESKISHKNTSHIKKLKSSAGEVTEIPLKKIKMKAPKKIQLSTGTVRVEEITPTKHGVHNDFRESPVTPRSVGFKVRHILSAGQDIPPDIPTESNKKYKQKRTIEEPQSVLPKPQWTQSGVFFEENLYPKKPIARTESTQFLIRALSGSRKVKKLPLGASDDNRAVEINFDNSSSVHNFKRNALFRSNIPRESSHEVVLRKKRQHLRNDF